MSTRNRITTTILATLLGASALGSVALASSLDASQLQAIRVSAEQALVTAELQSAVAGICRGVHSKGLSIFLRRGGNGGARGAGQQQNGTQLPKIRYLHNISLQNYCTASRLLAEACSSCGTRYQVSPFLQVTPCCDWL